jgi:hypothetical protein
MFDEDYKDSWAIKMIKRPFQNPKEMAAIKNKGQSRLPGATLNG